jgi:hypothetical protein
MYVFGMTLSAQNSHTDKVSPGSPNPKFLSQSENVSPAAQNAHADALCPELDFVVEVPASNNSMLHIAIEVDKAVGTWRLNLGRSLDLRRKEAVRVSGERLSSITMRVAGLGRLRAWSIAPRCFRLLLLLFCPGASSLPAVHAEASAELFLVETLMERAPISPR